MAVAIKVTANAAEVSLICIESTVRSCRVFGPAASLLENPAFKFSLGGWLT